MLPNQIPVEEIAMPSMSGATKNVALNLKDYSVKYLKASLGNVEELLALQEIETRGLQGQDIVLLNRDKFVFEKEYYIVVQYLEKNA